MNSEEVERTLRKIANSLEGINSHVFQAGLALGIIAGCAFFLTLYSCIGGAP